jgi:putative flippase GtrA
MTARLREVEKFLTVGAANTLVGLAVIYAAKWFFRIGDIGANALGYSVGLLLSFTLNSRWTFAYRGANVPAFAKFTLVTLVAYAANLVTVLVSIRWFGVNEYLAQAAGVVPYTLIGYLGSKHLAFAAPMKKPMN